VTRLRAGRPGFDSRQGQGTFGFRTARRPALRPNQPPIQWVPGGEVCEAGYSPPSSALRPVPHGVVLRHTDTFTVSNLGLQLRVIRHHGDGNSMADV
jgi:hypothetical protein